MGDGLRVGEGVGVRQGSVFWGFCVGGREGREREGVRTAMRVELPQARAPRVTTRASQVWSQSSPGEGEGR